MASLTVRPFTAPEQKRQSAPIRARRGAVSQTREIKRSKPAAARTAVVARTPEESAERARIRTVLAIVALVVVAGMGLAAFLLPADMVIVGGTGIALTFLLFGIPFWISAIDEAAEQASARARAAGSS
jgi:hypothetical protein